MELLTLVLVGVEVGLLLLLLLLLLPAGEMREGEVATVEPEEAPSSSESSLFRPFAVASFPCT